MLVITGRTLMRGLRPSLRLSLCRSTITCHACHFMRSSMLSFDHLCHSAIICFYRSSVWGTSTQHLDHATTLVPYVSRAAESQSPRRPGRGTITAIFAITSPSSSSSLSSLSSSISSASPSHIELWLPSPSSCRSCCSNFAAVVLLG